MSGAEAFDDAQAINAFMDSGLNVDVAEAVAEHTRLKDTLEGLGVQVVKVPAPLDLQDGVYTANWAIVRGDKAVLSSLPPSRQGEQLYAKAALETHGKTVYEVPRGLKFSGQGDALPCGNYLFCGSGYRTDPEVHAFLAEMLDYEVIRVQTVPLTDEHGQPLRNAVSGWPDSYFYDLDLALSVLKAPSDTEKGLIGWCPEAFLPESQQKLREFDGVDKIEVSLEEARDAFACNLISTGQTVIMSGRAPRFQAEIEQRGLEVITLSMPELAKGGGFIRCTTLTLDNI
jgi:N-dimethylarginine dimethylaminohydrolase